MYVLNMYCIYIYILDVKMELKLHLYSITSVTSSCAAKAQIFVSDFQLKPRSLFPTFNAKA